jgi:hypothetical protein
MCNAKRVTEFANRAQRLMPADVMCVGRCLDEATGCSATDDGKQLLASFGVIGVMGDLARNRQPRFIHRGSSAFAVLSLVATLAGCGGDEEGAVSQAPAQAPTISGSPPRQALQGRVFGFTPTAIDPNGDPLTFSIANRPSWATFNSSTGRLSGAPSSAQVGNYPNVQISVSDGVSTAALAPFDISVVAVATGSAILSWTPPLQNTDGSSLTNLAGYRVYFGTAPGDYPNSIGITSPGLSSYVVEQLTAGTWYFVLTAVNSAGQESAFSNAGSKQIL